MKTNVLHVTSSLQESSLSPFMKSEVLQKKDMMLKKSILNSLFSIIFFITFLSSLSYADTEPNNDCSHQETVSALQNVTTALSTTVSGTLCESGGGVSCTRDDNDYYRFTVGSAGVINVNYTTSPNRSTDFYLSKTSCGSNRVADNLGSYSGSLTLNAGDTVYIRVQRNQNNAWTNYNIAFSFTPPSPPVVTPISFNVNEDATNGTTLGTVSATWSPTVYQIVSGNIGNVFTINNSGVITVADRTNLDYETRPSYTLSVRATNAYGSGEADVTINVNDIDEKLFCPGEVITNLHHTTSSATDSAGGTIGSYQTYYYFFTPDTDGIFQVDSYVGGYSNSLYVREYQNGNCDTLLWQNTVNSNSKSSPDIQVTAHQTIVVALYRSYNSSQSYSIDFSFTVLTPEAVDDTATTEMDQPILINVVVNDTRVLPHTVTLHTNPTHGTATVDGSGNITYTPDTDYIGTDQLTYAVTDDEGNIRYAQVTITITAPETDYRSGDQPFELVNPDAQNVVGNYAIAGNTLLCITEKTSAYGGSCQDSGYLSITSNDRMTKYIDIDSDPSTWNSSSSYITIPNSYDQSRGVIWAGLFWQGRISAHNENRVSNAYPLRFASSNGTSYSYTDTGLGTANYYVNLQNLDANKIKLKINSGTYQSVQANTLYWTGNTAASSYAAYADVTKLVKAANLASGKQTFTIANLTTSEGRENSIGTMAGWSLVVIYLEDLLLGEPRNISIYNGYALVDSSNTPQPIRISGFKLPKSGDISAQMSIFSGEGEYKYGSASDKYDWMKISNAENGTYSNMPGASDPNNIFDAILDGITRDSTPPENALQVNNCGVDIDNFDVSNLMTSYRNINENVNEIFIAMKSNNDYITPSMVAFSAALYVPRMCYDYTYKQDGHVYTEANDGTQVPHINISTNSGNPIDVTIYIKSLDSDVDFRHVSVHSDFNLSKINYKPGYFKKTHLNGYGYSTSLSEALSIDCNEADNTSHQVCRTSLGNFRAGIGLNTAGYPLLNAGSFTSGDFIYFQFSVDPKNSSALFTPLGVNVDIQYALSDGTGGDLAPVKDIPLGDPRRMSLCPPSDIYMPEWGIFNIIDRNINLNRTGQSGNEYFNNLLTQVPQRPFTVDVVALDASENPPTRPQDINTSVAVELVDIKGFHDVNISCQDPAVAISNLIHINFSETNRTTIPNFITPYAKEDVAFRIWYIHDGNVSNIITDWWTDVVNGNIVINNLYNQIPDAPTYCGATCASLDAECFDCIKTFFGYPLCSRDNFAVRPESYLVSIYDRNASGVLQIRDNNETDVTVSLAADYDYELDMNATNHLDSNSTRGYLRSFSGSAAGTGLMQLTWNEPTAVICNDESNSTFDFRFSDGMANNIQFNKPNVGFYTLSLVDNNWTYVDQGTPLHHTAANYFITNATDCLTASSVINDDNLSSPFDTRKVGCTIRSSHTVDTRFTGIDSLVYKDYNITFKPYSLSLDNLTLSHGPDADTDFDNGGNEVFLYMSDLDDESNMSINAMGIISARGKNGTVLSNYVGGCYAEDINITLLLDNPPQCNPQLFGYRFINLDINDNIVTDMNLTGNQTVALQEGNFTKERNGTMSIRLHYNFDRNITTPINPERLTLAGLSVGCANADNCIISADQDNDYEYNRTAPIDNNVTFIYGRVHAPRYRIEGNEGNATLYYEVYWDGNATCNLQNILPNPMLSVDSVNWYRNTIHQAEDGNSTGLTQHRNLTAVTDTLRAEAQDGISIYGLNYNGTAYPYRSVLEINTQPWLIYDRFDPAAIINRFDIEFSQKGVAPTDAAKMSDDTGEVNTNRRIMW